MNRDKDWNSNAPFWSRTWILGKRIPIKTKDIIQRMKITHLVIHCLWHATPKADCNRCNADRGESAINNHICPHCKNDRVNRMEKSCWKCGGNL